MNFFYLIRHAHTGWSPDEQRPLSERGQVDAGRVADLLSNFPIDRIFSSPYRRARQTVEPLASRLTCPVLIEPDLRERELGVIPARDHFLESVKKTWENPAYAHPGGESNAAAQRRGVAVIERLQEVHSGEHMALSTHGNLLALVLQHFDPCIDYAFWKALTMPDVYELRVENDQGKIVRLWKREGSED